MNDPDKFAWDIFVVKILGMVAIIVAICVAGTYCRHDLRGRLRQPAHGTHSGSDGWSHRAGVH